MKGSLLRDNIAMFIISHSPCLQSIVISGDNDSNYNPEVTDYTLESIAEHCTGLQSLSLSDCINITDTGLITISEHCPNLRSLKVNLTQSLSSLQESHQITDDSIISISTHCAGLQILYIGDCNKITDASFSSYIIDAISSAYIISYILYL